MPRSPPGMLLPQRHRPWPQPQNPSQAGELRKVRLHRSRMPSHEPTARRGRIWRWPSTAKSPKRFTRRESRSSTTSIIWNCCAAGFASRPTPGLPNSRCCGRFSATSTTSTSCGNSPRRAASNPGNTLQRQSPGTAASARARAEGLEAPVQVEAQGICKTHRRHVG